MKRIPVLLLILFFAAGGTLAAFDVGGSLTSGTDLSTLDIDGASTEAEIGLWLESGKGEHYSFEAKLDLTAAITNDGFDFIFNPDYLKLDGFWDDLDYGPSILATSLGRFSTSDFSGKVFSQTLDGLIMNFNYPSVELTIAAGTTALMFSESGKILTSAPPTIMSKTDALQMENNTSIADLLFDPDAAGKSVFDSPRAVELITLSFPDAIAKQSFTLSFVAQEDLRPMLEVVAGYSDSTVSYPLIQEYETEFSADTGGAADNLYIGAGISGPSIESLYHSVYYYFGTGRSLSYVADGNSSTGYSYQYETILSHMAGFSLDYFMPWLFNSRISLGANFGTGDADADSFYEGNRAGYYTQFTPVTSSGGGMIFMPGISNILSASAGYSIKPFEWVPLPFLSNIQISATAIPFFKITDGPISVSGISTDFSVENGNYLGSEIDLGINWRPFSDLGANAQIGYFMPGADVFEEGSDLSNPTFMAKLNVSLSF